MNAFDPTPRLGTPLELDRLLRSFFQVEMPHPWPAWQPPAEASATGLRRRPLTRSRFALAAALLVLLGGFAGLADYAAEPIAALDAPSERLDTARRTRAARPPTPVTPSQRSPVPDQEGWMKSH
jgi:hypothetical protein